MINKLWLQEIERYTFIDKVERKGITYYFFYTKEGKQMFKTLPLRATGPMVQKVVKAIKNEVGVNYYGTGKEKIYGF